MDFRGLPAFDVVFVGQLEVLDCCKGDGEYFEWFLGACWVCHPL